MWRLPLVHTVSFDCFLSGLEWVFNLEFCLLKLIIFYQKLLWNIRSRLNSSTFWVFRPAFLYVWSKLKLWTQKMKILILAQKLKMWKSSGKISKVLSKQNSKLRIHSKPDRNQSKLTVCSSPLKATKRPPPVCHFLWLAKDCDVEGYKKFMHLKCLDLDQDLPRVVTHGLLYIWTELLSNCFWWSAHMRRELGTQITPRG